MLFLMMCLPLDLEILVCSFFSFAQPPVAWIVKSKAGVSVVMNLYGMALGFA
jgi:hypothetical protein